MVSQARQMQINDRLKVLLGFLERKFNMILSIVMAGGATDYPLNNHNRNNHKEIHLIAKSEKDGIETVGGKSVLLTTFTYKILTS